ncbi:hypothetical protein RclHR1_01220058 [Rhizophagus clarus]|nr:hypothetical protein RclHR1_01220058 [Rhizophagus clarus]
MIGQQRQARFITVKNKRQDRVVGMFDYPELCEYLDKLHNIDMESLDDIIEDVNKNIKKVFLAGVAPEFRQEAYIIGLKLILDRLTRELEFAQKDDYSSKPARQEQVEW